METLSRERPTLLIEIEERHAPGALRAIPERLRALEYEGWFLSRGTLRPLSEFDARTMQDASVVDEAGARGLYLNNFLFFPKSERWPGQRALLQSGGVR